MQSQRIFLGWTEPCLPTAAAWLLSHAVESDLGGLTVVVPSSRAGERLLDHLATSSPMLIPPTLVTLADLPERLYRSLLPLADAGKAILARMAALRAAEPETIQKVFVKPPCLDDWPAWMGLAHDWQSLAHGLAGEGVPIDEVVARCAQAPDFNDTSRWEALALLEADYQARLKAVGLEDQAAARFQALARRDCRAHEPLIFLATPDLPGIVRLMLGQSEGLMTALIHAPEDEAQGFDQWGCLVEDYWLDKPVELEMRQVHVVDRPRDQVRAALRLAQNALKAQRNGQSLVVALGDTTLAPLLERTLDLAGVPAGSALPRSMADTRPARLLAAMANYLLSRRFDDLAALLRHPDMGQYLVDLNLPTLSTTGETPYEGSGAEASAAIADWLTLMDRYITQHVPLKAGEPWLGQGLAVQRLRAIHQAVEDLIPRDAQQLCPLSEWRQDVADLMVRIYGHHKLQCDDPQQRALAQTLETLGQILNNLSELEPASPISPQVSMAHGLLMILDRLASRQCYDQTPPSAIELVDWSDLTLEDASAVIITGFNEGSIPRQTRSGTLAPDHLCAQLGLSDNRRRYARDLLALTSVLRSRREIHLIAGRRSGTDDPLTPSRLLLACPVEEAAGRIVSFYQQDSSPDNAASVAGEVENDAPSEPLLVGGSVAALAMPLPKPPAATLECLPIRGFRDYLKCPYRFYLKHVVGLEAVDDGCVELSELGFGSLAHQVLFALGRSDLEDTADAPAIEAYLNAELDRQAARLLGDSPRAAIFIQREQLRSRLRAISHWHASHTAQGWRMMPELSNKSLKAGLEVDGRVFTIHGRIDRVDMHPGLGYQVLDYSTGDTTKKPEQKHQLSTSEGKIWCDLNLPLMGWLARQAGHISGPMALGFVQMPKKAEDTGLTLASWTVEHLDSALEEARRIIRAIRAGTFWPPSDPSLNSEALVYSDGLELICLDAALERGRIIERLTLIGSSQRP